MKVEHLKKNGEKVEIDLSDFYDSFVSLERKINHRTYVKCNWVNNCNELTNFEINITDKNHNERYIVTNPDFSFIFNLVKWCSELMHGEMINVRIQSEGDIDQKFKNSIVRFIDVLSNYITADGDIINNNYIKYNSRIDRVRLLSYRIIDIVDNFFSHDIQLKNDIVKRHDELIRRIHEIINITNIIKYVSKFAEEICSKKNVKDRDNKKIDLSVDKIEAWLKSFPQKRLYE